MNVGAASLGGNYAVGAAILAGLIGGVAFLAVVNMGLASGMTRMNFLWLLGSMVAPKAPRRAAYGFGLAIHMMASAAFGLIHAGILTAIDATSVTSAAAWDVLIGGAHGVGVLVFLPMMLVMAHPLVRTGDIEKPRALLTGFGPMTPLGSLVAHVLFGLVTGSVYAAIVL